MLLSPFSALVRLLAQALYHLRYRLLLLQLKVNHFLILLGGHFFFLALDGLAVVVPVVKHDDAVIAEFSSRIAWYEFVWVKLHLDLREVDLGICLEVDKVLFHWIGWQYLVKLDWSVLNGSLEFVQADYLYKDFLKHSALLLQGIFIGGKAFSIPNAWVKASCQGLAEKILILKGPKR